MALLAEQVPEDRRRGVEVVVVEADLLRPLDQLVLGLAPALAMPAKSPFTSATNTGTPAFGQALGENLQGDRLAGAGGAGDQPVPVGHGQVQHFRLLAGGADENGVVGHGGEAHMLGEGGGNLLQGRPDWQTQPGLARD